MPQFAFIECGEEGRVKKDDDWLVRSHCMLGKNKKCEIKPRVKRKEKTASEKAKAASKRGSITPEMHDFVVRLPSTLEADPTAFLPGSVDRKSYYCLWRYSRFLPDLFPLDNFIDEDPFVDEMPSEHEGALKVGLMTASTHCDYLSYTGMTRHTQKLIANSISYLNKILDKEDIRSRNFALNIIGHLIGVAAIYGDFSAAYMHLNGVNEVFRLHKEQLNSAQRASSDTYPDRYEHLRFKTSRLSFSLYYMSGIRGPFFTEIPSWDSACNELYLSHKPSLTGLSKLDTVFYDLQELSQLVRRKAATNERVNTQYFRRVLYSLELRVLALPFDETTIFGECVRLGIACTLCIQTRSSLRRVEYRYLNDQFRRYLSLVECPDDQVKRDVMFWIIIAAFVVTLDPDNEPWIESLFRQAACDIETWQQAKEILSGIVWFPPYVDDHGKMVFEKLRKRWPSQRL